MTVRAGLREGRSREEWPERARQLETQARRHPERYGSLLNEAASLWARSGEVDHALELYTRVLTGGAAEAAQLARVGRAGLLAERAHRRDLEEELVALGEHVIHHRPAHLAGELLRRLGRDEEALEFFDRACATLWSELTAIGPKDARNYLLYFDSAEQRARLREELGEPADRLDRITRTAAAVDIRPMNGIDCDPPAPAEASEYRPIAAFVVHADVPRIKTEKVLLPQRLATLDPDRYLGALETQWRDYARAKPGGRMVTLVPVRVDDYWTFARERGALPAVPETRAAYLRHRIAADATTVWPPPRDAPCWCGAREEYGDCCARRAPRVG